MCPVGYADDMAARCLSKMKLDRALAMAYDHSVKWQYAYNAKKSSVMVYGETKREHDLGSKYRTYRLGPDRVREDTEYDHVGIKNCLYNNFIPRTQERISKGRKSFNSILSSGIRKNGVNMAAASTLFWTIVVPTVTYGSELWVMGGDEIDLLLKFQRYAGRRCQRFPDRTPNFSAYSTLGWLSIEKYIYIKKLLFFRTVTCLDDDAIAKRIVCVRANSFIQERDKSRRNENSSPIYDLLNVAEKAGLLETCMNMVHNGWYYSKDVWSKKVWKAMWDMEDEEYQLLKIQLNHEKLLFQIIGKHFYLTWWLFTDLKPNHMKQGEIMANLVCDTSLLKANDYRMKRLPIGARFCEMCYLGIEENVWHLVMQCPFYEDSRVAMYQEIDSLELVELETVLNNPRELYLTLMGKHPEDIPLEIMMQVWDISSRHISNMYKRAISSRYS